MLGNARRVPGVYLLYYVSGQEKNTAYLNNIIVIDFCGVFLQYFTSKKTEEQLIQFQQYLYA